MTEAADAQHTPTPELDELHTLLQRIGVPVGNWLLIDCIVRDLNLSKFRTLGGCVRASRPGPGHDVRFFRGNTTGLTETEAHSFTDPGETTGAMSPRAWTNPERPIIWCVDHPVQPAPTAEELARQAAAEERAAADAEKAERQREARRQRAAARGASTPKKAPKAASTREAKPRKASSIAPGDEPLTICPDCFTAKSATGECLC